jgi:hypothetical protein
MLYFNLIDSFKITKTYGDFYGAYTYLHKINTTVKYDIKS